MCYYSFLIKKAAIREVFDFTLYKLQKGEQLSCLRGELKSLRKEEWADKRAAVFIFGPASTFYFPSNDK